MLIDNNEMIVRYIHKRTGLSYSEIIAVIEACNEYLKTQKLF